MTDYNLAGLSTRSFEQLIQAIALKVVSPGVVVFGDGADGGREATFNGLTRYPSEDHPWNGYIVIQAKFRQRPQNSQEDGEWALKQLKSELEDFANPKKRRRQPDYYIFATNVVLTPVQDKGTKDKADDIFQEFKDSVPLKGYDIWDYDKIRVFLDNFEDIRRAYTGFITPGDVLSQIMDFIEPRKELFADQYTNSEDIEVLVQKVRSHFDKTIQNECETLCTFNLLYSPMRGNLSQIYVQTKLNESQRFSSEEFSQERRLWKEVVRRNSKLMVLGKPGAGKTTLLQYIAVHCDEVDFQPKLIPVFISLKTLAENAKRADEISLMGYIRKKYCRSHISEKELEVLLDNGRLLFLLDGLDEVIEDKNGAVVKEINHLVDEYGDNRVIVSCRKEYQAYKSKHFGNFILCKVAYFEQRQRDEFIKNWFAQITVDTQLEKETLANALIEKLESRENKRIQELADTPLLLHLICLISLETGDLPSKKIDIYKEAIDLLLEKWNQFNDRFQLDTVNGQLDDLKKSLRRIATITFEDGKSSFEEGEILPYIKNGFNNLSEIEVLSGLLVKKKWKTYTFSHQTFQEYLMAEELVNSQQGWRKILIHIAEPRWRKVFFMVIEMVENTEELLRKIKQKFYKMQLEYDENFDPEIEEQLNRSKKDDLDYEMPSFTDDVFQGFLTQASQKSNIDKDNYKPLAVRAFYWGASIILTNFISLREYFFGSFWFSIEEIIDLSCRIDCKFLRGLKLKNHLESDIEVDYHLILAFGIASQLAYKCGYSFIETSELSSDYNLCFDLDNQLSWIPPENNYCNDDASFKQLCLFNIEETEKNTKLLVNIPEELLLSLQQLKKQLPTHTFENWQEIVEWWGYNGEEWLEKLANVIKTRCNMGFESRFDFNDLEILLWYYDATKLVINCLNSGCKVPEKLRTLIEDNLFLPLDSSPS